jgi:hypothetical protein
MSKLLKSSKQLLDCRDEAVLILAVLLIPVCAVSSIVGL